MALLTAALICGCEGITSPASSGQLCINEVVTSNSYSLVDQKLGSPDWIELYNPTSKPIDLEGYGLTDNIKNPHKYTFPSVTIPAGGYLIVYASKYEGDSMCTGFGLSKSGDMLYLVDPYYNVMQQLEIPELVTDVSYARAADGNYGYCSTPTPGEANGEDIFLSVHDGGKADSDESALAITEVMPKNTSTLASEDGRYYPWAEIKNTSDKEVLMSDYYLSDSVGEPSKYRLPGVTLGAGEYAIVYFSGKEDSNAGEIHASFRLGKGDSALLLSNGMGSVVSMFNWTNPVYPGISVVAPDTYCAFPTPGQENSQEALPSPALSAMDGSDPIHINEVLKFNEYSIRDCFGDRSPWVELYNSSDSAASLSGCFLSDDADDPFKWAFPEVSIEPKGYLIVFLSGKNQTEGELHTSFTLSKREYELMFLSSDAMRYESIQLDPKLGDNVSVGISADGSLRYYSSPTPGGPNTTHEFGSPDEAAITTDMSGVYISEVSAVKAAKSRDTDWIELHNASGSSVNLEGWHLTDDANDMKKFTFPSFKLPAGEYASIAASTSAKSGVSAPFNISASGDTLILTDGDGNIRDVFSTGALSLGVTSGRTVNSPERVFFTTPTRSAANPSTYYSSYADAPMFSDRELYHSGAFELTLSSLTPNAEIHYTTDGSKPTTASPVYSESIRISSNTVIKAISAADGLIKSDIAAATYLFEEKHTVPVVCLSIGKESFDEVYSVTDRWKKVEREGFCEYYEPDGTLGVEFPCGLRVNGASTLNMRQKSMSIFLRGGYGQSSTKYNFFPGNEVTEYTSLAVRNSGQDASKARIRDSFFSKCVEGLNIDNIKTRSVVVYINGQYWGLYDLNENQNEDYLATHYGVDPSTANIIRRNETPLAGDRADFKRVRNYALTGDISGSAKYEELCQWVDVDYFMDYLIAQTYFANGDMFNQKYWRTTDYKIKWRPIYYDLDLALGSSSPTRNVLPSYFNAEGVPSQDGSLTNMDIYVGLRKNRSWCEKFGERYVYVVYNYFTPEKVTTILDDMVKTMEPEMARHIKRWGIPSSMSAWKSSVSDLRGCLQKRTDYALSSLQKEFGFSNAQMEQWKANATAQPVAAAAE